MLDEQFCILLVDDVSENIDLLRNILMPLNTKILVANGGNRALEIIKKKRPDLILLDVMMPDIGGFEVCEQLKQQKDTQNIPIIFVTGKQTDISKGYALGAVDYILKPVNADEVKARVNIQIELFTLRNALANSKML